MNDFEKALVDLCEKYNIPVYHNTWQTGQKCITLWTKEDEKK